MSARAREALTSAIRALLCDPPLRAKMGARGRSIAEAEFSEQQVVAETLGVYHELLAEFDLQLQPMLRSISGLIWRVDSFGDDALPALLACLFQHLLAVAFNGLGYA